MKELFDNFKKIPLSEANNLTLIDTSFFVSIFENPKILPKFAGLKNKAMTSFNILELIHIDHKLVHIKHNIRKFLENSTKDNLVIIDVDVTPGNRKKEIDFANQAEPGILKYIKDPSDAVLLATAILTNSSILTKDKHHIFNQIVKNHEEKYGHIKIYKELKDAISS